MSALDQRGEPGIPVAPSDPSAASAPVPPAKPSPLTARRILGAVALIVVIAWSFAGTGFSAAAVVEGLPNLVNLIGRMLPPDLSIVPTLWVPILETVRMAIVGTALAAVISLPLGFLAARNITPHPLVRSVLRPVLNALRTIPELIFALLFVAAVGLGPFAGVMALLLGSLGFLAKMYSESLESVDPRPVEALQAVGSTRAQAAWYAVLPQAAPVMASFVVYLLEINFRAATILGVVGAGGIGYELNAAIRLFQYQNMMTILIAIGVCVALFDFISAYVRKKLL